MQQAVVGGIDHSLREDGEQAAEQPTATASSPARAVPERGWARIGRR